MKIFKRITQSIITLTSVMTLAACGSGSEGLQVEADLSGTSISLSKDQCIPFTVTRPEATESALKVMVGRVSGLIPEFRGYRVFPRIPTFWRIL
jgi:hypothetical protein